MMDFRSESRTRYSQQRSLDCFIRACRYAFQRVSAILHSPPHVCYCDTAIADIHEAACHSVAEIALCLPLSLLQNKPSHPKGRGESHGSAPTEWRLLGDWNMVEERHSPSRLASGEGSSAQVISGMMLPEQTSPNLSSQLSMRLCLRE